MSMFDEVADEIVRDCEPKPSGPGWFSRCLAWIEGWFMQIVWALRLCFLLAVGSTIVGYGFAYGVSHGFRKAGKEGVVPWVGVHQRISQPVKPAGE